MMATQFNPPVSGLGPQYDTASFAHLDSSVGANVGHGMSGVAPTGMMMPGSGQVQDRGGMYLESGGTARMGGTALPSESALQTMNGEQMWAHPSSQFRMPDSGQGFRMQQEIVSG